MDSNAKTNPKRKKTATTRCASRKFQPSNTRMKKLICIAIGLIVAQLAPMAVAQQSEQAPASPSPKLQWQFSPYSYHFSPSDDHKPVFMVGLEREHASGKLDGLTFFSNSFGQECLYIYPWGGVYKNIFGVAPLSFKWTAGLLYGYTEPYENKVPFNYKGFSPGAIIALAYEFKPGWSAQVNALGTAALMFQLNVPFK